MAVSRYFNVTNPPKLIEDLEDPFINHALTSVCCELYYKYGMYPAPFTAMLTTARHIDFNKIKNIVDNKNQNLNQENQNPENQTNNQDPKPKKEKNSKRVAAGKKGAEARWKRMQAQQIPTDQAPQEAPQEQEIITREPQTNESTLKVNVYKNYIPLCAVLIFGIGIFMLCNKSMPATQVTQPPQQSTPKSDIDPFEMN